MREVGNRAGEGSTLNNLGQLVSLLGHRDEAARYCREALAIQREVGDRPGEALGSTTWGAWRAGSANGRTRQQISSRRW